MRYFLALVLALFLFSCGDDKIVNTEKCKKDKAKIETVCGQQLENFCVLWAFPFDPPCFVFSDQNNSCFQCVLPECKGCLMTWQGSWTNQPSCDWEWVRPTTNLQCMDIATGQTFTWYAGVKLYNYAYQHPL